MPRFPYDKLGINLERDLRITWNQNLEDIEADIKELNGAQLEALEAADAATTATENVNEAVDTANQAATTATEAVEQVETVISNAEQATTNANDAASNANTEASNLSDLKTDVTQATTNANDAANNADQSATEADAATQAANTATDNANTATTNANSAADSANTAAADANEATTAAQSATDNAIMAADNAQDVSDNTGYVAPWDSTTTYNKNNIVELNGSSFMAKQDTTGNAPPTLPETENAYWGLLAQRGVDGEGAVSTINTLAPDVNGNVTVGAEDVGAIPTEEKGVVNGVATINADGQVLDASGNVVEGKVKSVNGEVGDVTVPTEQDIDNKVQVVDDKVGNLTELETDEKGNIVNALNSTHQHLAETLTDGVHGMATTQDITYYVDAVNGSDDNDGLMASTAFRTIQYAVDLLPQIINHSVTIDLIDGNYSETVSVLGFVGKGSLSIIGNDIAPSSCTTTRVALYNCGIPIDITGLTTTTPVNSGIDVDTCMSITINNLRIVEPHAGAGVEGVNCNLYINSTEISNQRYGIYATLNSNFFSYGNSGTGNDVALRAIENATIGKHDTQPTGTTAESISGGGVIR